MKTKHIIITAIALLLTYDIILTYVFSAYYCLIASPNPKTLIEKKVEYPESIYWEDNVYPGFSKEDRELMIINYLDGVHLKTMALNGDDGKIYVYQLEKPLYKEFIKNYIKTHPKSKSSFAPYKAYANEIMKSEKIYTKQTMPKINYTVTFNEIKLNPFARYFLYSDERKVIENNTGKVIAYNRRYMRFYYNMLPDFAGGRYYVDKPMCGSGWLKIHLRAFKMLNWRMHGFGDHRLDLNKYLYKKYIKGEK
jgi:hypothetical protein